MFTNLKALSIPEGVVVKIADKLGNVIWSAVKEIINWVLKAIEADSTAIYNGGLGYKNGWRLNSSGNEVELAGSVITGYIPFKVGDIIRIKGVYWGPNSGTNNYFVYYRPNFGTRQWHINSGDNGDQTIKVTPTDSDGIATFDMTEFTGLDSYGGQGYFRIAATGNGEDMIVTINQEIEDVGPEEPEVPATYTNQVPISIDTDGSIYNGVGYIDKYRLSSSGALKSNTYSVATGFIPAKPGDTIRIGGLVWHTDNHAANYLCAYDADFNYIGATYRVASTYGTRIWDTRELVDGVAIIKLLSTVTNIAYIRVSTIGEHESTTTGTPTKQDGSKLIVTVNQEIV